MDGHSNISSLSTNFSRDRERLPRALITIPVPSCRGLSDSLQAYKTQCGRGYLGGIGYNVVIFGYNRGYMMDSRWNGV